MCGIDHKKNKTSLCRTNDIEVLSERLEFLKIMNEQSDEEISVVPASAIINNNIQAITLKSMVPDPEWFDGNRTKFKG